MKINWSIVKKLWTGLTLVTTAGILFIFFGVPALETRQMEAIENFISALPGDFQAGRVNANFLTNSFTISNLTGTIKNADGSDSTITVYELTGVGLNREAQPGAETPLLEKALITELSLNTTDSRDGVAVPRTITVGELSLYDITGNRAALPAHNQDAAALFGFLGSLGVGEMNVQSYADSENTRLGQVTVAVPSLDFKSESGSHGVLADLSGLTLPGVMKMETVSGADRQAISDGFDTFQTSGGALNVSLRPDGPLSPQQLEQGGSVTLNAEVRVVPAQ